MSKKPNEEKFLDDLFKTLKRYGYTGNTVESSEALSSSLTSPQITSPNNNVKTGNVDNTKYNKNCLISCNTGLSIGHKVLIQIGQSDISTLSEKIYKLSDNQKQTLAILGVVKDIVKKFYEEYKDNHLIDKKNYESELSIKIDDIVNEIECNENQLTVLEQKFNSEIRDLQGVCDEILLAVEGCYKTLGDQGEKIDDIGEKIDDIKELIQTYIKLAESRHLEVMSALYRKENNNRQDNLPHGLDLSVIAKMFKSIKDIKAKMKEQISKDDIKDIVSTEIGELNSAIIKINENIGNINSKADDILQTANGCYELAINNHDLLISLKNDNEKLFREVEGVRSKLDTFSSQLALAKDVEKRQSNNDNVVTLSKDEYNAMQTAVNELKNEVSGILSTGKSSNKPCPFCGYKTERVVFNNECGCNICGHTFTETNPLIKKTNSQIKQDLENEQNTNLLKKEKEEEKAGKNWREIHTVELENVSEGPKEGLYRMKFSKFSVNSHGVLVIPPKYNYNYTLYPQKGEQDKTIKKIAFCEPNTDDKDGKEQMKKVKTLILPQGVELEKFHEVYPFADMENLDRVLQFTDEKETELRDDILKEIKGLTKSAQV